MARNITDDFVVALCVEQIEVVYQCRDYLIVNKPSGLLSLSGKNPRNRDSVHFRLTQQWPDALMVHRLDYGTSGLLIVALTKSFATQINQQFQAKQVIKEYQALVHGLVTNEEAEINAPIARDDANFPKMKVCNESGKPATTRYQVVARDAKTKTTRLKLMPLTGRTHQLRLHCAYVEHPIVGCDIYGYAADSAEGRLRLHAKSIAFLDPVTKQPRLFDSDVLF